MPLQVHFDLKTLFGLPEAVMTDNTIEFHTPVRLGDVLRTHQVLRSVSDEKTTKLGTGRFWVIDVVYANQDGELVAVESYTGFGYRERRADRDEHRGRTRLLLDDVAVGDVAARTAPTRSRPPPSSSAPWPPATGAPCTTTRTSRSSATGPRTSS